jgi:hypothetical protein
MIEVAFHEDKTIVEAQQRLMSADAGNVLFVNFPFDRAGQSARRILKRLMSEEQTAGEKLAAAE